MGKEFKLRLPLVLMCVFESCRSWRNTHGNYLAWRSYDMELMTQGTWRSMKNGMEHSRECKIRNIGEELRECS